MKRAMKLFPMRLYFHYDENSVNKVLSEVFLYILLDREITFYFLLWPSPVAWYLFSNMYYTFLFKVFFRSQ